MGEAAVPELMRAIEAETEKIGSTANLGALLEVLGRLGPHALGATGKLQELYARGVGSERPLLLRAMARIAPFGGAKATGAVTRAFHTRMKVIASPQEYRVEVAEVQRMWRRRRVPLDARAEVWIKHLAGTPDARCFAAELLFYRRARVDRAAPALAAALARMPVAADKERQEPDRFRETGSDVLIRMAPSRPVSAIAYALRMVYTDNAEQRRSDTRMLTTFGADAQVAIPHLLHLLRTNGEDRWIAEAVTALGTITMSARLREDRVRVVTKALRDLQKHRNESVASRARMVLRMIERRTR